MSGDWGDDLGADPGTGEVPAEEPTPGPALRFKSLDEFVGQYLSQIYRRDLESQQGLRWCREWWKHAEGIARLEAMWRAWELLRLDPGEGGSNWWLNHCDPHMRVLMSETGPFRNCKKGTHAEERSLPLPVDVAPTGMFPRNL